MSLEMGIVVHPSSEADGEPNARSRLLDHVYDDQSGDSGDELNDSSGKENDPPILDLDLGCAAEKGTGRKCTIGLFALLVVGAVLVGIGGAMFPVVDWYIREQVKERVIVSNTSETYEIWQDVPVPVYMQFYVFNIENPDEVQNGETPVVEQIGPFTYRERRIKFDIQWHDNGTVTYKQNRTFQFVRNMSIADEEMEITTINPLIATLAQNIQWWNAGLRRLISIGLSVGNEDIIMTRPAKEVLFGYNDPMLSLLNSLDARRFPTTKIGYFIRRNYTDDGIYTIQTGESDIHSLGFITEYNGAKNLDLWTTKYANMINGTDGTFGPPFRFDAEESPVFVSDLCRSIRGIYVGDVKTPQGIGLRRFGGDRRDMENATLNPDNIGFCTPQTNCLPTGLLNSTLCQEPVDGFLLPVVFSFPHFLYADPAVKDSVVGMNPVEEEHQTVIDQEPWTGLVLQVAKRLQINMYVKKVNDISQTHNIQSLYFPIVWLNESSVVDDHWANKLQRELFTPMEIASGGRIAVIALGAALMVLSAGVLIWRRRSRAGKENLKSRGGTVFPSSNNGGYDKPLEGNNGPIAVISDAVPREEDGWHSIDGRNSADTLDGDWHDPATFDGDGNDDSSSAFRRPQDSHSLVRSEL